MKTEIQYNLKQEEKGEKPLENGNTISQGDLNALKMRYQTQAFENSIMKNSVVSFIMVSSNCNGVSPEQNVCDCHNNQASLTTTSYQHTQKHYFPISLSHTDRPLLTDSRTARLHNMNNVILGHQLSSSGERRE